MRVLERPFVFFYSEIRNITVVLNGHSFFYNEIQNFTVLLKRPSPSRQILVPRTSRGRPEDVPL